MQELDNIGDANRWEDPRDTSGGQADVEDEGWHNCHFCGDIVSKRGYDTEGQRHFLSDCRPDLVQHEPGPTCTWHGLELREATQDCYAFQDRRTNAWGDEHIHFYSDGPM
jgi:hypothetical protein